MLKSLNRSAFVFILSFCFVNTFAQEKPKLVVGVVVDQMRAEYLYRFQDNYSELGFKRLMKYGYNVKNTHYNYVPTGTGPGHASIYSGTTPTNHGIVYNNWYSRALGRAVYCAEDTLVNMVDNSGIQTHKNPLGRRSPRNLMVSNIADELKLFSNERSKVIGVSLKDRGAIFPAGHMANAAYWYNPENGNFITSSYYTKVLPDWMVAFNKKHKADSLLNLIWSPLLPFEKYAHSDVDNASFEKVYVGKKTSEFPYNLKALRQDNGHFKLLPETPYGNTLLTQLALSTLKNERLGKGIETDFLTISYSSTDYVGHHFGIRSKELEDTYVRLDREIAQLLNALDQDVGKGKYLIFLTADHGASDTPVFLKSKGISGEFYNIQKIEKDLNESLSSEFGLDQYIAYMDNTQIYFKETRIPKDNVVKKARDFLKTVAGIKEVYTPTLSGGLNNNFIKNSFNPLGSGDIYLHFYSGWMPERNYGTTHGNAYNGDTHVPLLWYGSNIKAGETIQPYDITQIAPTLSFLLGIPLPNAANKKPIVELFN